MSPAGASETTSFSAESYFATQLAPPTLEHDVSQVREFVQRQIKEGRKVVLVTVSILPGSGGIHRLTSRVFRAAERPFL